jgi:uncharacterized protein
MTSEIQAFLAMRRIAMIGVSHEPKHFSRAVFRAWRDRGYEMVPVNPAAVDVDGLPCYPLPREISPAVDAALVMTPPAASENAARDCVAAGIRSIWLYRPAPAAEVFCRQNGVALIVGECPLMYLPKTAWPHRVHRWFHARA